MKIGNKRRVLESHPSAIAPSVIGNRMFSQELIVRALQYFAGACAID